MLEATSINQHFLKLLLTALHKLEGSQGQTAVRRHISTDSDQASGAAVVPARPPVG